MPLLFLKKNHVWIHEFVSSKITIKIVWKLNEIMANDIRIKMNKECNSFIFITEIDVKALKYLNLNSQHI